MPVDSLTFWLATIGLALGTYALRVCFLVILDSDNLPNWLIRHLNYTAVAILPALIAPMVVLPKDIPPEHIPTRALAAFIALFVGILRGSVLLSILTGMGCLYLFNFCFH